MLEFYVCNDKKHSHSRGEGLVCTAIREAQKSRLLTISKKYPRNREGKRGISRIFKI